MFISLQGYSEEKNYPFFKEMEILTFDTHQPLSVVISPYKYMQRHSSESCLFSTGKICNVVSEASKKQVLLKSNSLKIRIDSVNQILMNKEKVA